MRSRCLQHIWRRVIIGAVLRLLLCSLCPYVPTALGQSSADFAALLDGFRKTADLRDAFARRFLLTGLCPTQTGILIGYGMLCGCAVGIVYNTLLGYAITWFPKNTGVCNGVLPACYGLATFPITAIAECLLNAFGWRGAMVSFGLAEGALFSFAGFLFTQGPSLETQLREERIPFRSLSFLFCVRARLFAH